MEVESMEDGLWALIWYHKEDNVNAELQPEGKEKEVGGNPLTSPVAGYLIPL